MAHLSDRLQAIWVTNWGISGILFGLNYDLYHLIYLYSQRFVWYNRPSGSPSPSSRPIDANSARHFVPSLFLSIFAGMHGWNWTMPFPWLNWIPDSCLWVWVHVRHQFSWNSGISFEMKWRNEDGAYISPCLFDN